MLCLAQLGCGYWGPNLLRNLLSLDCDVKWLAEKSPARRDFVRKHYPQVPLTDTEQQVLDDPAVQGVLVATPAASHYELVRRALLAGKHVFVEKPLALTSADASELTALAARQQRVLMVGHTFLYNDAVRALKKMLDAGELGELRYVYCQRLNLGQVRQDVNAWWNLAPHDVSILLYLLGGKLPATVTAVGQAFVQPGIHDVVFGTLQWPSGVIGHIHVSWLDPGKVRRITVVGSRKMVVFDDVSDQRLTVYDKGVDRVPVAGERMDYDLPTTYSLTHRSGDIVVPNLKMREPLSCELQHFLDCMRSGATPLTGGQHGRDVVAILEAGDRSLQAHSVACQVQS